MLQRDDQFIIVYCTILTRINNYVYLSRTLIFKCCLFFYFIISVLYWNFMRELILRDSREIRPSSFTLKELKISEQFLLNCFLIWWFLCINFNCTPNFTSTWLIDFLSYKNIFKEIWLKKEKQIKICVTYIWKTN